MARLGNKAKNEMAKAQKEESNMVMNRNFQLGLPLVV